MEKDKIINERDISIKDLEKELNKLKDMLSSGGQ